MAMEPQDIKRAFLKAVQSGDKETVTALRRQLALIANTEIPPFIEYSIQNDKYCLSWQNKVLTKEEFLQLKKTFPNVFFWNEEKTYI